ncbi:MAG TPA: cobyric acid synthase [Anaeromyxobacteraceae bacterium]|nr:cobyric acid synthase [Anaeromyxobacteraceae bacterium]
MTARALMVQGTASSVGKSLVVAGLCRLFRRAGLRVAPFKAQNMALNAAVASDGGEIGRAQHVQAEAAGIDATVQMNPILLKPEGDARSQVVLLGRPWKTLSAAEYHAAKPELRGIVRDCLGALRERVDLVVIEGAGSPAEVNLKDRDIVNMDVAKAADAPVLLVGDIDRGGVFAAFVGTIALLEPDERARVAAFVFNKFRGDRALLAPGFELLRERTGIPTLGVLPWLRDLGIADEDSAALDDRRGGRLAAAGELDVAVVRLPRVSNFDDFAPLEQEPGVRLRFVERPGDVRGADLLVLPGTKCTLPDLVWLRASGFADEVAARARRGEPVLGVCGGCQMLGTRLEDPHGVESDLREADGLGLLPLVTRFDRQKLTARCRARAATAGFLAPAGGGVVEGYEIHMGTVGRDDGGPPAFAIHERNGRACSAADGAVSADGAVVGTLIHGILENDPVRAALLDHLRARRSLPPVPVVRRAEARDAAYDRLARTLRDGLDWRALCRIAGFDLPPPELP